MSHMLSLACLSSYEIVRKHSESCELRAANNALIPNHGIVDIQVRFVEKSGRAKVRTLTRCIVAEVPFNVMSPFVLVGHGWECCLTSGSRSCLKCCASGEFEQIIPLEMEDRSWWACANLFTAGVRGRASGAKRPVGSDMELDVLETPGNEPKREINVISRMDRTRDLGSLASVLRVVRLDSVEELVERGAVDVGVPCVALDQVDGDVPCVEIFQMESEDESIYASGVEDGEDHELPPPQEMEDAEMDGDEALREDAEAGARGHQPYLAGCRACARARGRSRRRG